jgi:hypothetical protein
MVTCGLEIKIYVDDVIGSVPIEFHNLISVVILANESTSVPEYFPSTAPWIGNSKVEIDHDSSKFATS